MTERQARENNRGHLKKPKTVRHEPHLQQGVISSYPDVYASPAVHIVLVVLAHKSINRTF